MMVIETHNMTVP